MRTKCLVYMDGVGLHEVSPDVVIQSIDENAPVMQHTTLNKGTHIGQWVTAEARSYLEVDVTFALRNVRDVPRRAQVLGRINDWAAGGGILSVNYRPGRRLRVVCETLPAAGDVRGWTNEYTLALRAYDVPYWEDDTEAVYTATASAKTDVLVRRGTARTPISFAARNAGTAAVQTLSVALGDQKIAFSGLGLAVGETLALNCGEDGFQRIRILGTDGGTRDAYACRTSESSDELLLTAPHETITLRAPQTMAWEIRHRGRYA